MSNVNSVVVSGRLTRDPEAFSAGAKLRLAVGDRKKNGDQWEKVSYYFDVTVFGKPGEWAVTDLAKGSPVTVQGRLTWREWEKDGTKRQAVEIIADRLDYPKSGESAVMAAVEHEFGGGGGPSDDIPFAPSIDGHN